MMQKPDLPPPRSTHQGLTNLQKRGRIVVVRCEDPADAAKEIRSAEKCEPLHLDRPMTPADLIDAWCGVADRSPEGAAQDRVAAELIQHARSALNAGVSPASIIEQQWELEAANDSAISTGALTLARRLMMNDFESPIELVRTALKQSHGTSLTELFQSLCELSFPAVRPILIRIGGQVAGMVEMLRWLISAVETSQFARLIVLATDAQWTDLQRQLDPHSTAVLRNGLLDWPLKSVVELKPVPESAPVGEEEIASLEQLARRAVTKAIGLADNGAAEPGLVEEAANEARSLAEALLHRALQNDPRTTGMFQLNADGCFLFGTKNAEIDLFCRALKIAVEVDGYFHFTDIQAYRRDRSKDWLMQQHGCLVLRFLAQDVVEAIEPIVDRIAQSVVFREQGKGLHGKQ